MAIREQLQRDIILAMKAKETARLTTLRSLMSELKNAEISTRREISEEESIAIVAKGVKTRQESAQQYRTAGRDDLVAIEESEIEVYRLYLPEQLTEQQLRAIIKETITKTGATSAKEVGKVMGALMPQVKGKADGALITALVKELLV